MQKINLNFKAIIFDFDGVILESVIAKHKAFIQLYKDSNKLTKSQIENFHIKNHGLTRNAKFLYVQKKILKKKKLSSSQIVQLSSLYTQLIEKNCKNCKLVRGVKKFIKRKNRTSNLFIVSNIPDRELNAITRKLKIKKYFKKIYGSANRKKDSTKKLLKKFKLKNTEVVMIGDTTEDYKSAKHNKIKFLGRISIRKSNPFNKKTKVINNFIKVY